MSDGRTRHDTLRIELRVHGRVQGVWFRGATRDQALALGLVGWARNLADGSVEVVAQGSAAAVEALVAWCHVGPPAARVSRVERDAPTAPDPTLRGFLVR